MIKYIRKYYQIGNKSWWEMEIHYKNSKTKRLCSQYKRAKKEINSIVADKLMMAINFIESAETLLDVKNYPPFRFHELKGNRKRTYAIDLGKRTGYRLILKPVSIKGEEIKVEEGFYQFEIIKVVEISEVSPHYE